MRHTRYQGAIIQDDKILLLRHTEHASGRSYWVIPGGGREVGEVVRWAIDKDTEAGVTMRHTSDAMTISHGLVALLRYEDGVVLVQQQCDDLPLFKRCCKLKWKES